MEKYYKFKNIREINFIKGNNTLKKDNKNDKIKYKEKNKILFNKNNEKNINIFKDIKTIIVNYKLEYKNNAISNYISILLLIFIIFFLPFSLTSEIKPKIRKLNFDSEITITINGKGEQNILNNGFEFTPDQVEVNGQYVENPTKKVLCSEEKNNIIKMKFNSLINTCYNMFSGLTNITKIDLSKFDTSQVTDMKFMFNECKNLEYIDLTNINTSSVKSMQNLFQNCEKLASLDLSYFDTSSVEDMTFLFRQCS